MSSLNTLNQQRQMHPVNMAIVYHSNYGHTRRVAESIKQGAVEFIEGYNKAQNKAGLQTAPVVVNTIDITGMSEEDWDYLDSAQLIAFGSAVYMGSVTAEFKTFMDESSKRWFNRRWQGKWAAGFANSGGLSGDKLAVLQQLNLFCMQHGMNWAGFPIMPTGHGLEDINRLSSFLGLMTQSVDGPPEVTPGKGDINTAKLFGDHLVKVLIQQPPVEA